jgi:hypothetical protein
MCHCVGCSDPKSHGLHFHGSQCAEIVVGFDVRAHLEASHSTLPLSSAALRRAPPRRTGRPPVPASKKPRDAAPTQRAPPPSPTWFLVANVRGDDVSAFVRHSDRGLHHLLHRGRLGSDFHWEGVECGNGDDVVCCHIDAVLREGGLSTAAPACALGKEDLLRENLNLLLA